MIYYIYKVRRKQTSIRFSRSVLTHRYLRSISWISWNGRRPPRYPPSTSWVPTPNHSPRTRCFRNGAHTPRPAIAMPYLRLCFHPENRQTPSDLFSRKRKHLSSLFPAQLSHAAPPLLLCLRSLARAASGPSAAGPSPAVHVVFCGPPINKKCGPAALRREPAQKSVDFSLKKNARRHAWLSRSCFGRVVFQHRRPAFATTLFPFSFFTKEKKKENRSKFSRFEYIARTHFVRPHDVRDWPVAPRPLKFM